MPEITPDLIGLLVLGALLVLKLCLPTKASHLDNNNGCHYDVYKNSSREF